MDMTKLDLHALCACGCEVGDHASAEPHPCGLCACTALADPGDMKHALAVASAMVMEAAPTEAAELIPPGAPNVSDHYDVEPEFYEEVSKPIAAPAVPAKPSALDDATHGVVVVDDGDAAGAMVWWRLSGTTDVDKVNAALDAAGFGETERLPGPSAADALRVAVHAQRTRHTIARPLPDGAGWVIVVEQVDANDLTWQAGLKVTRNPEDVYPSLLTFDPPDHPGAHRIEVEYEAALAAQSTGKVGSWLTRLARRSCDAIGLRENGGVYFIPATHLVGWKARIAAVRSATKQHAFALVPAMRTEDAVAAVVDALTAEAAGEATALEAEVMEGDLTARSLDTRAERARGLAEKVARYAKVMGAAMPDLQARLDQLQATIAAATLAARAEAK